MKLKAKKKGFIRSQERVTHISFLRPFDRFVPISGGAALSESTKENVSASSTILVSFEGFPPL
jgi:hypothetical protein